MNEKYIQVLLDELYEKKILNKYKDGYAVTHEFAKELSKNTVKFQGGIVGLLVTIIDWIPRPIQIVILEYHEVLSTLIGMKNLEAMLKI